MLFVFFFFFLVNSKSDGMCLYSAADDLIYTVESTTAYEQDVLGVYFDQLLFRVFTSALWWNQRFCTFQELQEALLYTFAANITGNGWIVAFTGDLIYLINIYYTAFCSFYI